MTRIAAPPHGRRMSSRLPNPALACLVALSLAAAAPSVEAGTTPPPPEFLPVAETWTQIPGGNGAISWSGPLYAKDQLLVQFRSTATPSDRARIAQAEGATKERDVTDEGLVKYRLAPGDDARAAIGRWQRRPEVEYATLNLRARTFYIPNDSLVGKVDWTWNLRSTDVYDALDLQAGDPRVVVAVIDAGVAYEDRDIPDYEKAGIWPGTTRYARSPELAGPFVPGWDFIHDDAFADDDNGHGTQVATIIAGLANNVAGSAGIAAGVTLMPIKVVDYQGDSDISFIVAGIRFAADHGAHVANLSLGFPPLGIFQDGLGIPTNEFKQMLRPLQEAVQYAQRRGVILVAASGNFGAPEVSLPSAYPGVIAVGATGVDDRVTSYSSFGRELDFVAPGGDFTDLNEDHIQDAVFTLSIKPHRSTGSLAKPDSFDVFPIFGTSASSAHVTGAVALLLSKGHTRQSSIESALRETAIVAEGPANGANLRYGNGLIRIGAALRVPLSGGGAVNAARSIGPTGARLVSPSPSRDGAALAFRLSRAGRATVRVFDVRGAWVSTVEDRVLPAGETTARWDGTGTGGARVAAGIYLFRIETPDGAETRKFTVLK
ncbi:MAG TPA: S8 family serine peptidase [Candidatus Eisenbacteria bacterium]|nr:S8 family serine peptidase [Candidatus Eisenbacteria bacterium]